MNKFLSAKKPPVALRVTIIVAIIIAWLVAAGVGGPFFGRIGEVSSNDLSTFLPESAESTKVKSELEKFQDTSAIPAIVVFESDTSLTKANKDAIGNVRDALQKTGDIKGDVSPAIISEDERAAFLVAPLDSEADIKPIIPRLKETVAAADTGLRYELTGPAMFSRDLSEAFAGIDGTLLVVALAVVFVILLIVYRSPILPVVTLAGAMVALASAILVVWHLAQAGIVQLNGQVQGILFILVIGATTDYSLLYIARYREELIRLKDTWQATKVAWRAALEPIVAAGGTVILGLLCLLVSDLGSNKALGPVGGIGIAFAIVVALSFLPAALALLGRSAFWPKKPEYASDAQKKQDYRTSHPAWAKVGALVGRHPRRIWVGISVLLLLACVAIPQLKAEGVSQDSLVIGKSEARAGQELLNKHFAGGSGSPVYIITPVAEQAEVVSLLDADSSVDTVSVMTTDDKKSTAPVGQSERELRETIRVEVEKQRNKQVAALKAKLSSQMAGAPEAVIERVLSVAVSKIPSVDELTNKAYPFDSLQPKVIDNEVVLQATLRDPASSVAAREAIARLRTEVEKQHPSVKIGGVSAIQLDTNAASERDLVIIIPLILLAITIVLMLLLRSIVAPLVLLLTTVVSFGATLGIAALLFNHVWQFPGADPAVVIFGFVFLVALGIDYNIFLMSRVREETIRHGVRTGTLKALVVTGGVITSAGIVLAATFAALYVIPILFLAQIAFIVAFGVLLDTLIVRSLLVPALTLEIGKPMWWPSKIAKKNDD